MTILYSDQDKHADADAHHQKNEEQVHKVNASQGPGCRFIANVLEDAWFAIYTSKKQ